MKSRPDSTELPEKIETHDAVERTIAAIVASEVLGQSDRRSALLQYLVREELSGRGDRIKAYSIAQDVFSRGDDFDPQTDSIVRTEIGRLRDSLRLFYAEITDPGLVEITIPKGSYRPHFDDGGGASAPTGKPLVSRRSLTGIVVAAAICLFAFVYLALRPQSQIPSVKSPEEPFSVVRIAVIPFGASGDNPNVERLAFGLYSELTMDLSVYPWMAVVNPHYESVPEGEANADYVLRGDIFWQGDELLSNLQLLAQPGQELVWTKSMRVEARTDAIESAQAQVARQVVERLASFHGVAPDLVKNQNARASKANLDAYVCFMGIYQYIETPDDTLHRTTRDCLTDVTNEFPEYGEAYGALAFLFMDETRQGRNIRPDSDPWQDATAAIDKARLYAPLRQLTLNVALVHSIEKPDRDLDAFLEYGARLRELFPRHPGTLANIALRSGLFVGDWDAALPMAQHAIDLQSRDPSWYFLLHGYHAILKDELSETGWALKKLSTGKSVPELIVRLIAAAEAEQMEEVAIVRGELASLDFDSSEALQRYILERRFDPELETVTLKAIEAAFAVANTR